MSSLPSKPRLLLGPGPSNASAAVLAAMQTPVLSHLDADLMNYMDGMRQSLAATFRAPEGSFCFAVSGTGTAAMETAVANLVGDGTRVLSLVGGYFADRLAGMSTRYGGQVTRLEYEWGRAVDPEAVRRALQAQPADVVTVVHAETSTGVLNPLQEIAAIARAHGALTIVDAVTSLGAHPLEMATWGVDCCYSCAQKGIGAPSGVAPVAFAPTALAKRVPSRSFYFDLTLLEDYWLRRKYHHTICASLLYALGTALEEVAVETLDARWARHRTTHLAFAAGIEALGLSLLPAPANRLWTLNAVRVPAGVDEAAVRKALLAQHDVEIGAGLGPLAGKIWRVGVMGTNATAAVVGRFLGAFEQVLAHTGVSPK